MWSYKYGRQAQLCPKIPCYGWVTLTYLESIPQGYFIFSSHNYFRPIKFSNLFTILWVVFWCESRSTYVVELCGSGTRMKQSVQVSMIGHLEGFDVASKLFVLLRKVTKYLPIGTKFCKHITQCNTSVCFFVFF